MKQPREPPQYTQNIPWTRLWGPRSISRKSKKITQYWRRSRQYLVAFFRVLEVWYSISHNISWGFCSVIANYFSRQYFLTKFTIFAKSIGDLIGVFGRFFWVYWYGSLGCFMGVWGQTANFLQIYSRLYRQSQALLWDSQHEATQHDKVGAQKPRNSGRPASAVKA